MEYFLFACSWKELVSKVNARMDAEQARGHPRKLQLGPRGSPQPPSPRRGEQAAGRDREDEEELEMGMEMIPCVGIALHHPQSIARPKPEIKQQAGGGALRRPH